MSDDPILIKRYPNRRYYASSTNNYVSLREIEAMVQQGLTVEIRDSQTGNDLTRSVLTQIIIQQHPELMSLFPTAMLHSILRSNDVMLGYLRDYFQHSLTYLEYLQRHGDTAAPLVEPMYWVRAWLESLNRSRPSEPDSAPAAEPVAAEEPGALQQRLQQLEARLSQLESKHP